MCVWRRSVPIVWLCQTTSFIDLFLLAYKCHEARDVRRPWCLVGAIAFAWQCAAYTMMATTLVRSSLGQLTLSADPFLSDILHCQTPTFYRRILPTPPKYFQLFCPARSSNFHPYYYYRDRSFPFPFLINSRVIYYYIVYWFWLVG